MIIFITAYSQHAGISPSETIPTDLATELKMNFTNKGLLIPHIALANGASFVLLPAPVAGIVVHNAATTGDITPGFYYINGDR